MSMLYNLYKDKSKSKLWRWWDYQIALQVARDIAQDQHDPLPLTDKQKRRRAEQNSILIKPQRPGPRVDGIDI